MNHQSIKIAHGNGTTKIHKSFIPSFDHDMYCTTFVPNVRGQNGHPTDHRNTHPTFRDNRHQGDFNSIVMEASGIARNVHGPCPRQCWYMLIYVDIIFHIDQQERISGQKKFRRFQKSIEILDFFFFLENPIFGSKMSIDFWKKTHSSLGKSLDPTRSSKPIPSWWRWSPVLSWKAWRFDHGMIRGQSTAFLLVYICL